jgi:hypothetical protein
MAVQAIRATSKETVPGVPSRLPALAGEAFGSLVLALSGTATLLAAARIGHRTAATVVRQIAVSVAFGFGILAAVFLAFPISGGSLNPAPDLRAGHRFRGLPGRVDLPGRPACRCRGRRLDLAVPQAGPPARRGRTRGRVAGPGAGRSAIARRRSGKVLNK